MILETAVGQARVGCQGVGWQGATTLLLAAASKEEQRGQRAPWQLHRVCSARIFWVSVFVAKNINIHGHLQRKWRGQLPFLG
ncbi:MAG: hypothetical protein Q8K21_00175 [Hydrogenophaga sp.]|uniref:hypothetical protein n=1 Tax=Hydrogenophaga sp. TaxID=1904254 RepID=UPI002733621B|nr:hypothetical protein [Hydrogenophaga sp.]MDP2162650.1 hypothetical protein [Hydrogenophaga sp.]MDP3474379.1 hypothetical protein [Hydrogenophaga sp.]